jgi:MFS family permease
VVCSNTAGWSAVASAGANTALAGVLAGFMLNGIVVLLSGTMNIGKVRALGLLFAAFVALGLDSYLFGLVTGDNSCQRAWTEAMLAAGLLGVGAVGIIAGFGLLVAEFAGKADGEATAILKTLFNFLRIGVALVVIGLLFMTSWNYLYAVLGTGVPGYAKDLLWSYLGIGAGALAILLLNAWVLSKSQTERLSERLQKIDKWLTEKWPHKQGAEPRTISGWLSGPRDFKQKVPRAMYASLSYTMASILAATFFARTSPKSWDRPTGLVTAAFGATIGWVLIVALAPLFYLLVRCYPPFGNTTARQDPGAKTELDPEAEQLWGAAGRHSPE